MAQYYTHSENDMKELNELSVGSLGIVKKNSSTAMSETSKILVVGLGGMGLQSVHELKKTLVNRIGKLRDSDIQFIAFDTSIEDLASKRDAGPLTIGETIHLISPSLTTMMGQEEHLRPKAFRAPMPPKNSGFNPEFHGQGAAQVRLTGRLSMMDTNTYDTIKKSIKNAITRLGDFTTRKLEIHVICGIGGGTGSGMCIDTPYIIRHVADELHIPDTNRRMFGHVYLPNAYDTVPNVNLPKIYRNGYAALKEIDYYMNINNIYETYDAVYPDGDYSSTKPIFDFCTLIGGHISAAKVIKDTKKAAISTCVEHLINEVTHTVSKNNSYDKGNENSSMADIFTSSAFMDNVKSGLSTVMANGNCNFHEGGNYNYTFIGASALKFPTDAIVEYFAGEVFTATLDALNRNTELLKQDDVDAFEKNVVEPQFLMKKSLAAFDAKVDDLFANSVWNKGAIENRDIDNALASIVSGVVRDFDEKNDWTTVACSAASTKAAEIFKNPAKGPYFLAKLLTSKAAGVGGISGFYEKIDNYAKSCNDNITKCGEDQANNQRQREGLKEKMQKFGHFKSNLEAYKNILKEIYKDDLKIKLYEKLTQNYYLPVNTRIGVCYGIRNALNNAYLNFADILSYIGEIMEANASSQKTVIYDDTVQGSIFGLTDSIFDALKNGVRHTVDSKLKEFKESGVSSFAAELLNDMLANSDAWSLHGVNPLESATAAVALRNFISNYPAFEDITKRTFSDYFDAAYRSEPDAQKDKIVRLIGDYLDTDSMPMCNVSPTFSWIDAKELCHRFMVLPNNMGEGWDEKFTNYLGDKNQNILLSPDTNAIYNYKLYASMPMWIHEDLTKYEKEYYKSTDAGVHINESEDFYPPYTDYPPLMPIQQWHRAKQGNLEYTNDVEVKYIDKVKALIEMAKTYGVLVQNDRGYFVAELLANKPTDEEFAKFMADYKGNAANYSADGLLEGGKTIYTAMKQRFGVKTVEVQSVRALKANEDANLVELIRRQMKLIGTVEAECKFVATKVQAEVDGINGTVKDALRGKEFAVFMLYGLIEVGDMGMWQYRLGENAFNIVAKLQIATDPVLSPYAAYMEMAVYKKFYSLETIGAHLPLLNKRKDVINATIFEKPEILTKIKTNFDKYTTKAAGIVETFQNKVDSGSILTKQDIEVKEFYEQLLKNLNGVMAAFSAD